MKKVILIFIAFSIFQVTSAQKKCASLPSSLKLLENLSNKPVRINPSEYLIDCNVIDTLKKRLLYLLEWQWTKQEVNDYLEKDIKANQSIYNIEKRAKAVAKHSDSLYKIAYDSIRNIIAKENVRTLEKNHLFGVDANIVLTVAYLNMTEAIPKLKEALQDPNHYNRWAIELALARLGDKNLQRKIIAECTPSTAKDDNWLAELRIKVPKLLFIATDESIFHVSDWLDTSQSYQATSSGGTGLAANFVVAYLSDVILNKDFHDKTFRVNMFNVSGNEYILFSKDWLIKNKKHYSINMRCYPL
jgi:hypothetical protein